MKLGHTSAYGIGCILDTVTGFVLDLTALSSYCQACLCAKARFEGADVATFQEWHRKHKDCNKNFNGPANGIEATAAEIMWGRSLDSGFQYTTMVSDGDSRTFSQFCNLKVYGEDVVLVKEECINHVAKQLGIALKKLATQSKKAGVTLGGKGYGKLTENTIKQLRIYYGMAIHAHPKKSMMRCGMLYLQHLNMCHQHMTSLKTTTVQRADRAGPFS